MLFSQFSNLYEFSNLCRMGVIISRHANPLVKYCCILDLFIGCPPTPKICCSSIATIAYGTRQKFNRCSTLNSKKNIFSFLDTVLRRGWEEKILCHPTITEKIYIFVSRYITTSCMGRKNSVSSYYHQKKNIFSCLATVLLHGILSTFLPL